MTRPLHFFGTFGALGILLGGAISMMLAGLKGLHPPGRDGNAWTAFVVAGVLILAGIQMLAIGLLGELQVRHYHTASHRAPYAIDRLVRLRATEEPSMLQEG